MRRQRKNPAGQEILSAEHEEDRMEFTKMQGCGNDYVYVNEFREKVDPEKKPDLVRKMSDRHFGVGSDGVIFIRPTLKADCEMEMWNADGTRSEMCGNGIRCVARYAYDRGIVRAKEFSVESFGKIKKMQIFEENGKVKWVRVNMGTPVLTPEQVPADPNMTGKAGQVSEYTFGEHTEKVLKEYPILCGGEEYTMTCVSMGNPHAVIFLEEEPGDGKGQETASEASSDIFLLGKTAFLSRMTPALRKLDLERTGPMFEHHACFPARTNTEFVVVKDRTHAEMRVWERGAGETFACGTGACAVAVACILNGKCEPKMEIRLLGGSLTVEWDQKENQVYMTGPAEYVYEGTWED